MRNGTVKHSDKFTAADKADFGGEDIDTGFYVWFGMWKGPFKDAEAAKSACREWTWEMKHS